MQIHHDQTVAPQGLLHERPDIGVHLDLAGGGGQAHLELAVEQEDLAVLLAIVPGLQPSLHPAAGSTLSWSGKQILRVGGQCPGLEEPPCVIEVLAPPAGDLPRLQIGDRGQLIAGGLPETRDLAAVVGQSNQQNGCAEARQNGGEEFSPGS